MKGIIIQHKVLRLLFITLLLTSCKKDWLNIKPDKALVVPTSLSDLQGLLDNPLMNTGYPNSEVGVDNFFVPQARFAALASLPITQYVWAANGWQETTSLSDWNDPYEKIFYANKCISQLGSIEKTSQNEPLWNNVRGSALFFRAYCYFSLAQMFCKDYNSVTANTDLGLPLRIEPTIQEIIKRSTIHQTYNLIINDLLEARSLLPDAPYIKIGQVGQRL
jgi:starch-binding outer membrane protein, SusD/RagB family